MTEDEAKTKWCPHVRNIVGFGPGETATANRDNGDSTRCIGSECMMWRWDYPADHTNPTRGYCGLAGKP